MIWVSVCILIVQIIIALVSYFTIYRHRVVFGITTAVLRMPHGTRNDEYALQTEHINKLLASGNYTVLQVVEREADKDLELILGKIKDKD